MAPSLPSFPLHHLGILYLHDDADVPEMGAVDQVVVDVVAPIDDADLVEKDAAAVNHAGSHAWGSVQVDEILE